MKLADDCCYNKCKKAAKDVYLLGGVHGVRFGYCERHRFIPEKLINMKKLHMNMREFQGIY